MPVILLKEHESKWLDPALNETTKVMPLLKPYPSALMEACEVSTIVNSPKNERPECVKPRNSI